jgi:hypothetical protein
VSLAAYTSVWKDPRKLKPGKKLVMLVIADFAWDDGWAWPGVETIANLAGLKYRQTWEILNWLVENDFLLFVEGGGWNGTNLYGICSICDGKFCPPTKDEIAAAMKNSGMRKLQGMRKLHTAKTRSKTAYEPSVTVSEDDRGSGCVEWPSLEAVLKVAIEYPGSMARGIPAIIPKGWAEYHFHHRTHERQSWAKDWKAAMISLFELQWQNGQAAARGISRPKNLDGQTGGNGTKKNGGVWQTKQRLEALKNREKNHEANELSASYCGEPSEEQWKDLEKLRREIRETEGELVTA